MIENLTLYVQSQFPVFLTEYICPESSRFTVVSLVVDQSYAETVEILIMTTIPPTRYPTYFVINFKGFMNVR